MSQTNKPGLTVTAVAPDWDELRGRAPYESGVHDDPYGGVVVHRCHPRGEKRDFFAFANYHETMKGYETKDVYLYTGESERTQVGYSRWHKALNAFQFRVGSHESCTVCNGDAVANDVLWDVLNQMNDDQIARLNVYGEDRDGGHRAEVFVDSTGSYSSGGTYDVPNDTDNVGVDVVAHPYVHMTRAHEVESGGNWSRPDGTLQVTLKTWFPEPDSGVIV